jgi:hypothetical protein
MTRSFPAISKDMMTKKKEISPHAEGKPRLLGQGRYAIYQTPEGDGVVVYRADGADADEQQVVPAKFWSLLMQILSGTLKNVSPMDLMKVLMSK